MSEVREKIKKIQGGSLANFISHQLFSQLIMDSHYQLFHIESESLVLNCKEVVLKSLKA